MFLREFEKKWMCPNAPPAFAGPVCPHQKNTHNGLQWKQLIMTHVDIFTPCCCYFFAQKNNQTASVQWRAVQWGVIYVILGVSGNRPIQLSRYSDVLHRWAGTSVCIDQQAHVV